MVTLYRRSESHSLVHLPFPGAVHFKLYLNMENTDLLSSAEIVDERFSQILIEGPDCDKNIGTGNKITGSFLL